MSDLTSQTGAASNSVVASAVQYSGLGGDEVISLANRSVRGPETGEVRIRVMAAAVNPTDTLLRHPRFAHTAFPLTPGMDAAGIVDAIGEGVSRLSVGDEVMAAVGPLRPEGGAQATYIVIPAASAVPKPRGVTFSEAATIPMNGLTAIHALDVAELSAGQTLAVTGGAGWLAYLTVVLAKLRGLRVVADAKRAEVELVRGYGADVVLDRDEPFAEAVRREFPAGVDALIDTALLGETVFSALKDRGIYIPVRGWRDEPDPRIQIKVVHVNNVLERTDWLEELRDLVASGKILPRVAREYPPQQVAEAQRLLLSGGVRGRPVIIFG